jgi:hypothetical protein
MVKIIINKKENYNLRIDFDNLTFGEFLELRKLNNTENRTIGQLSILAKMPIELVQKLNNYKIEQLKPFLEFLQDTETVKCKPLSEKITNIKVGNETWHKIEQVKMLLKDVEPMGVADKIVSIYLPIDIKLMLMPEAIAIVNYFFTEIKEFFAKFVRLNDYKPDNDELMAGVNQLNYLGYVNTLDALAQGNLLNYEGILETSADRVYTKLLKDFESSLFQKRLQKVKENKK